MATYRVQSGTNKAPSGLTAGDRVVTNGGTYKITGVNSDGSYKSEKVNNTTTHNYKGSYAAAPGGGASASSGRKSNGGQSSSTSSLGTALGGMLSGGSTLGTALGTMLGGAASMIGAAQKNQSGAGQISRTPGYAASLTQPSGTDYGVLLRNAMNAGATADEVERILNSRVSKAIGSPDLQRYAYDDLYALGRQYIDDYRTRDQLKALAAERPAYSGDPYYTDDMIDRITSMDYADWTNSDQYQALADRYGLQGQMSMQDVLGQISSRTGGLASSYATTAAQQQYNDYMSRLEEAARQMYEGDRSDLMENYGLMASANDAAYSRYLDELGQYNADYSNAYNRYRDAIADQRYNREYADSQASERKADAQNRINAYLAAYGDAADLDPALVSASGYTQSELAALQRYYADQQAATTGQPSQPDPPDAVEEPDDSNYEAVRQNLFDVMQTSGLSFDTMKNGSDAVMNWLENQVKRGYITDEEETRLYKEALHAIGR